MRRIQPNGGIGRYCVQSIIGATEKRRESEAVCRGIRGQGSESAGWNGAQFIRDGSWGWEACFATFTTSSADVVVCGICQEFVGDLGVLDTGSMPVLGCV